jgi:hypothetical protein
VLLARVREVEHLRVGRGRHRRLRRRNEVPRVHLPQLVDDDEVARRSASSAARWRDDAVDAAVRQAHLLLAVGVAGLGWPAVAHREELWIPLPHLLGHLIEDLAGQGAVLGGVHDPRTVQQPLTDQRNEELRLAVLSGDDDRHFAVQVALARPLRLEVAGRDFLPRHKADAERLRRVLIRPQIAPSRDRRSYARVSVADQPLRSIPGDLSDHRRSRRGIGCSRPSAAHTA